LELSAREVAERVAQYKVHILIEKPLATTLEDGQAIIDRCRQEGVKLYYGASYRTLTANIKAREMIRNGELGEISMALELVVGDGGLDSYKEMGPHHYRPGTPGGCGMGIVDHGSKGALKVYPYAEQLVYFAKDTVKPVRLEQRPMPGNFTLQMDSFVDSILKDREPAVTGKDGMKALKIILAAYESAEKQQLIKL
jgi:predicted dehydrogenase